MIATDHTDDSRGHCWDKRWRWPRWKYKPYVRIRLSLETCDHTVDNAYFSIEATDWWGPTDSRAFYMAARLYNSGEIDGSMNLEAGIATHCYSSDIANRLTGWVLAEHRCYLD